MPSSQRHRPVRLDLSVYERPGSVALRTTCCRDRRRLFEDPALASALVEVIREVDGGLRRIHAWCVMPDHLHLVASCGEAGGSLVGLMRSVKGRFSARARRLGVERVWQATFHDHLLREGERLEAVIRYVLDNPVRGGLVERWEEYPWSGSCVWSREELGGMGEERGG